MKVDMKKLLLSLIPKWKKIKNAETTARDLLSLERTLLAWLRTSLASIALGVAVAKFVPGKDPSSKWLATITGVILVIFGLVISFYAIIRNFYMNHIIVADDSMCILDNIAPILLSIGIVGISGLSIAIMFV